MVHKLKKELSHKLRSHGLRVRQCVVDGVTYEVPQHINNTSSTLWSLRVSRKNGKLYKTYSIPNRNDRKRHVKAIQSLTLDLLAHLKNSEVAPVASSLSVTPPVTYRMFTNRVEVSVMLWGRSTRSANPKAKSVTRCLKAGYTRSELARIEREFLALWYWRRQTTESHGLEFLRGSELPQGFINLPISSDVTFELDRARIATVLGEPSDIDVSPSFQYRAIKKWEPDPLLSAIDVLVGERFNQPQYVEPDELIRTVQDMDSHALRSSTIAKLVTYSAIDAGGRSINELDFTRAIKHPLPLLPVGAPKTLRICDTNSLLLALYLTDCVRASLQHWQCIKNDSVNHGVIVSMVNNTSNANQMISAFAKVLGIKHPHKMYETLNQLRSLSHAGIIDFTATEDSIHYRDDEHSYELQIYHHCALRKLMLKLIFQRVVTLHDEHPLPVASWTSVFRKGEYLSLYSRAAQLTDQQRKLEELPRPTFRPYHVNPFDSSREVVCCSCCGSQPEVYVDDYHGEILLEVRCSNCPTVKAESSRGSMIDAHKAMIRWTHTHRAKLSVQYCKVHNVTAMIDRRVDVLYYLREMQSFLDAQVDFIELIDGIPMSYLKEQKVWLNGKAMSEKVTINKLWCDALVDILTERANEREYAITF